MPGAHANQGRAFAQINGLVNQETYPSRQDCDNNPKAAAQNANVAIPRGAVPCTASAGLLLQREANHVTGGRNVGRQATVRKQVLPDKVTEAVPSQTLPTSILSEVSK
jgi:hypothetical protein